MFSESDGACVDISSSWGQKRPTIEGSTQTSEILTDEKEVQTRTKQTTGVQTDEIEARVTSLGEDEATAPALLEFLRKTEKEIEGILKSNKKSAAFDGYDAHWSDEETDESASIILKNATYKHLQATSVGWNCRGAVIGVGYGRTDHETWCTHQGSFCSWNISRLSLNCEKPDLVVELPTCVQCMQWHPEHPAIVALGGYNGTVYVVDTSQSAGSELVAECTSDEYVHSEPVSQILWREIIERSGKRTFQIVSASGDGTINSWTMRNGKRELVIVRRMTVRPSDYSRDGRRSGVVGITSLSLTRDGSQSIIVGLENGDIVKYNMDASSGGPIALPSATVVMTYAPHDGPVYGVANSIENRSVFMTCSSDGTMRLYHALQVAPLISFDVGASFVLGGQWLPGRPCVTMCVTDSGQLVSFDLKVNQCMPVLKLDVTERRKALLSLAGNSKRPRMVAVGDIDGFVHIVSLPKAVFTPTATDAAVLNALATELTYAIK